MKNSAFIIGVVLALFILFYGCAAKPGSRCTAPGDTPQFHYIEGMEALERNMFDVAQGKFERAIFCDKDFSVAYGGLAIVYAYKTALQKDPDFETIERKKAIEYVDKSDRLSKTQEDKFDYYLSVIRVNTYMDGKKWLNNTENAYRLAKRLSVNESNLIYYQAAESVDYFMGLAYLRAHHFQKAREMFASVLKQRPQGKWQIYADMAWKKTDKIARAAAGITVGDIGKRIAVQDKITRGELAALLVQELKIDKTFAGKGIQPQVSKTHQEFTPPDIVNYPFKEEVLTLLKWNVRGIEPKYDEKTRAYLFKPIDQVNRGEMALVLEDILIKFTGNEKIATAHLGHDKSPFHDIKPTSPFYNAVINVTTRGIMEGEATGEFMVDKPVSGADAILAIRVLKQTMNIK